jgi:hypothetical protein
MIEIFLNAPTELQVILLFGVVAIAWSVIRNE